VYSNKTCMHYISAEKCKLMTLGLARCEKCGAFIEPTKGLSYEQHMQRSIRNLDQRTVRSRERVKTVIAVTALVVSIASAGIAWFEMRRADRFVTKDEVIGIMKEVRSSGVTIERPGVSGEEIGGTGGDPGR
jgi:hypothetical protein